MTFTSAFISVKQTQRLFACYDQWLTDYQDYWQFSPFAHHTFPWPKPSLKHRLEQLSLEQLTQFEQQPTLARSYFAEYFPELTQNQESWPLTVPQTRSLISPFWLSNGIKGRKLEQIAAFCQQLHGETRPVLEWCAGKGHLGRFISYHHQLPVTSLEWQAPLCEEGQQLAQKLNLSQHFEHCDVLAEPPQATLNKQQHVVALHACGELHLQLLRLASQQRPQRLSLCPCCYHLISTPYYQPLSEQAQQSSLQLSKADLRLAVAQSVTSGQRVQNLRQTEIHWRLSYQCLREQVTGQSDYQALPSVAKHWFAQGSSFADFAQWASQQHQLALPESIDWADYLNLGRERHLQVRKSELIQQLFRPILERWLILDRCLFLQKHGYQLKLVELFPFQTSPRNVLIQAELP
ncbi:class I SAM-dependent methyltransferase [Agarivorans sp. QJM3NY_25]|uniref:class I SAM-dependent methyltransferase n=1 Tax=Agarivorans sp. QJM3NY_25 TaxID=3421430 RepID=UPI003D7DFADA